MPRSAGQAGHQGRRLPDGQEVETKELGPALAAIHPGEVLLPLRNNRPQGIQSRDRVVPADSKFSPTCQVQARLAQGGVHAEAQPQAGGYFDQDAGRRG